MTYNAKWLGTEMQLRCTLFFFPDACGTSPGTKITPQINHEHKRRVIPHFFCGFVLCELLPRDKRRRTSIWRRSRRPQIAGLASLPEVAPPWRDMQPDTKRTWAAVQSRTCQSTIPSITPKPKHGLLRNSRTENRATFPFGSTRHALNALGNGTNNPVPRTTRLRSTRGAQHFRVSYRDLYYVAKVSFSSVIWHVLERYT